MDKIFETMKVEEQDIKDVTIFRINGALTTLTSVTLKNKIDQALGSGKKKLILNLLGTKYMSSAGLKLLLITQKQLNDQTGKLIISNVSEPVLNIITITQVNTLLDIVESEEKALEIMTA